MLKIWGLDGLDVLDEVGVMGTMVCEHICMFFCIVWRCFFFLSSSCIRQRLFNSHLAFVDMSYIHPGKLYSLNILFLVGYQAAPTVAEYMNGEDFEIAQQAERIPRHGFLIDSTFGGSSFQHCSRCISKGRRFARHCGGVLYPDKACRCINATRRASCSKAA